MSDSEVRARKSQEEEHSKAREAAEGAGKPPADGRSPASENATGEQGASVEEDPVRRIRELESRTAELEAEKASLQDELLRKAADFENFRKRMFRDKEDAIKFANAELLNDVLPIIDDFERAIQSAGESKDFEAFHAGVSLIERQLVSVLERKWGLTRFSAAGEIFDPERHEAIAAEETEEHEESVVLEEYQKGYTLHDRVLRPAKVKVAKPVSPRGPDDNNA